MPSSVPLAFPASLASSIPFASSGPVVPAIRLADTRPYLPDPSFRDGPARRRYARLLLAALPALVLAGAGLGTAPEAAAQETSQETSQESGPGAADSGGAPPRPAGDAGDDRGRAGSGIAPAGGLVLDAVTVLGRRAGPTEGRDDYRADDAGVASRIPTAIRHTPRSISVVTRDRPDDQLFLSDSEAIANTVGMRVTGSAWNETITSRGFASLNNVDGLKMNSEGNPYQSPTDAFLLDSIEIMRGPAGLLEGAGMPGGVVNRTLKRPRDTFGMRGGLALGSFGLGRVEADIHGPLTPDRRLRARLVGVAHDRGFFHDESGQERKAVLGSVEADISDDTTVSLSGVYQKDDNDAPFHGLPARADGRLLDVRRSTYLGADWGRFDTRYGVVTGRIEHRFGNGWTAHAAGNYFNFKQDELDLFVSGAVTEANGGVITGSPYRDRGGAKGYNLDVSLNGDFHLFGRTHDFVAGASYMNSDYTLLQGSAAGSVPFDVFNPKPRGIVKPGSFDMFYDQKRSYEQYGVYGQMNVRVADPLIFVAGGRLSWASFESFDNISSTSLPGYDETFFTPLLGLVYDVAPATTLYANYAGIFRPQTASDLAGKILPPITGTQYEAGIRQEVFGGGLTLSAAAFHILRKNEAISQRAPDGRRYSVAAGKTRSRGFELEAVGRIAEGWKLYAGYAFTDARILKATSFEGNRIANTPRHRFNLWTSYGFRGGLLDGLEIGGGVTVSGKFYDNTNAIEAPAFVTVDLGASYRIGENFGVALKVNNVFDRKYYRSVGTTAQGNYYGEPRSVLLQGRFAF